MTYKQQKKQRCTIILLPWQTRENRKVLMTYERHTSSGYPYPILVTLHRQTKENFL